MTEQQTQSIDDALARAVVYRTLSTALQQPTRTRLERLGVRDRFPAAVAALDYLAERGGDQSLARARARLASLPPSAADGADEAYWRLFGHTARGPICSCETEYGDDNAFHQPQQLADISGYYRAFGLQCGGAEVRVDHIACECEFMDFLSRKEALLSSDAACGDAGESLETTRQAGRTFLRDHLGRFGCAFGTRLAAEDAGGYYGVLGEVLLAFLRVEAARAGVRSGPTDLPLRAAEPDETPMACGSADELIQIRRHP
jgi:putative dimethyl sulfoxide reductase chaperone